MARFWGVRRWGRGWRGNEDAEPRSWAGDKRTGSTFGYSHARSSISIHPKPAPEPGGITWCWFPALGLLLSLSDAIPGAERRRRTGWSCKAHRCTSARSKGAQGEPLLAPPREGCRSIRSLMSFHLALSALFSTCCWLPVPCWQAPARAQEGQAVLPLTQVVQEVTEAPCPKISLSPGWVSKQTLPVTPQRDAASGDGLRSHLLISSLCLHSRLAPAEQQHQLLFSSSSR